jgi:hypothetical protein
MWPTFELWGEKIDVFHVTRERPACRLHSPGRMQIRVDVCAVESDKLAHVDRSRTFADHTQCLPAKCVIAAKMLL